ncbi:BON domain-containing protein [Sedimenticola selenatireducens]|jgi:osmotically-inducible protein OsmY|uniref:BON domain-containing protein n=1 Tax=Sedimenticola selenatireducens TaxID=191960 RepID=A0A557SBV5_9GAMM|nr:BON domain-containing protein [Sedimenticola selenatireducens]TVO74893.1 BON domain-containing protein [Sedimenticola selenatireducens]TVT62429.1 MAG: BON domain-containing protein [Sedimenticola selenatireducens]
MRRLLPLFILFSISLGLLQGCATAVVGGAATGASVIHDRRSAGTILDDKTITIKIMNELLQQPELREHSSMSASAYNHLVLLTGQAESESYRSQFEQIASNTPMVKRTINEVQVGPNATLTQQSKDTWITSKAKIELFNIDLPGFDPTRVKVITEKGVVYLMGMVTPEESTAVVEKIRYLDGVVKVVKVFEYL